MPGFDYADRQNRDSAFVVGLSLGSRGRERVPGSHRAAAFALIGAGVLPLGQPTVYDLADGPKALAELETRATVGKLALVP